MPTTESDADHPPAERRRSQRRAHVYLVGIATGLAATLCTALFEWVMLSRATGHCGVSWTTMIIGTLGRVSLTHACSVLPIMILVSLPISAVVARNRDRRPDAWHAAFAAAIAGIVVGWADIAQIEALRHGPRPVQAWHAFVATGIGALIVLGVVHLVTRTRLSGWYRRALGAVALAGIALFAAAPFLLRGTLLAGPDAYRLSPALLTDGSARLTGPPNILYIVLDTVRADHLSHYGHTRDTSPFLAELSQKGLKFERALSAGIHTLPSHSSMFTGLSVREHGVKAGLGVEVLHDQFETFAERARALGYQTVLFSSNAHVSTAYNLVQGFDRIYPVWSTWKQTRSFLHYWLDLFGMIWPAKWLEYDIGSAMTSYLVAEWLADGYDPDRPFLVFINYMEAHTPHRPPLAYRRRFLDDAALKRSYEVQRDYASVLLQDETIRFVLDQSLVAPEDLEIYRALYDASLRYLDDRLRELFALLKVNRMLDNTVVIIVSDHGEGLGNHGIFGHQLSVYDMLARVPLTIYVPRYPSESEAVPDVVSTAALFDVVCAAVVAEQYPDAKTLARIMIDRAGGNPVVTECLEIPREAWRLAPAYGVGPDEGILRQFWALSHGSMKYIIASDGTEELYDIAADPGELNNVSRERPEVRRMFSEYHREWAAKTPVFKPESIEKAKLTPSQLEMLRMLGYIQE